MRRIPPPQKRGRTKKQLMLDKAIRLMALMFFVGFFTFYFFGAKTAHTWINLSRIPVGFAVVLSFIPVKRLPYIYRVHKELKIILAVFALAPLFSGMVLLLNFYTVQETWTETHIIESFKVFPRDKEIEIKLADKMFRDHHQLRRFSFETSPTTPYAVDYEFGKGLIGLKVIKGAKLKTLRE